MIGRPASGGVPFTAFVGVDWSGAAGARQGGIAVARCGLDGIVRLERPGRHRLWARTEVLDFIAGQPAGTLVGLDFAFSLPWPEAGPFPPELPQPASAAGLWEAVDRLSRDAAHLHAGPLYRPDGGQLAAYTFTKLTGAPLWRGPAYEAGRLRRTEQALVPPPSTVFKIVGARTVGPGSFSGMRMLAALRRRLGDRLRVWPFDDADAARLTLCEIYPTSFYRRHGRGRTWSRGALDGLVQAYGASLDAAVAPASQDEADALLSAAALSGLAGRSTAFELPPATLATARREGWIFGVGVP